MALWDSIESMRNGMHDCACIKEISMDKYNAIVFEAARRREVYLVGGFIRDLLRGIVSQDRDYVVRGNVMSFVLNIQKISGGTIVPLHGTETVRIALRNGCSLDFNRLSGTIEGDLSKRDFAINALAWSPLRGVIDLYGGIEDLRKKIVRSISAQNLIDDPLRMLRAYRFAAELQGKVDVSTRNIIKNNHKYIYYSSDERITLEMFNLLNADLASTHLKTMLHDKLLNEIIPLSFKVLGDNIKQLILFEKRILQDVPNNFKVLLHTRFSQNLTYKGLLCLHILLKGSKNYRNIGRMSLSRKIIKRIATVGKTLSKVSWNLQIPRQHLYPIFEDLGDASADFLIITNRLEHLRNFKRFQRINAKSLLNSRSVMEITGLKGGEELGWILSALKRAHFEGRLKSRRDALAFITKNTPKLRNII